MPNLDYAELGKFSVSFIVCTVVLWRFHAWATTAPDIPPGVNTIVDTMSDDELEPILEDSVDFSEVLARHRTHDRCPSSPASGSRTG